jgi:hypothetical protein
MVSTIKRAPKFKDTVWCSLRPLVFLNTLEISSTHYARVHPTLNKYVVFLNTLEKLIDILQGASCQRGCPDSSMTKGYVVFTTYGVDVDTFIPSEEGAHSPTGQTGLSSSSSSSSQVQAKH